MVEWLALRARGERKEGGWAGKVGEQTLLWTSCTGMIRAKQEGKLLGVSCNPQKYGLMKTKVKSGGKDLI